MNTLRLVPFADAGAAAVVRHLLDVHLVEQYLGEQLFLVELFSVAATERFTRSIHSSSDD